MRCWRRTRKISQIDRKTNKAVHEIANEKKKNVEYSWMRLENNYTEKAGLNEKASEQLIRKDDRSGEPVYGLIKNKYDENLLEDSTGTIFNRCTYYFRYRKRCDV